jgi:hypothetical protein
MKCPQGLRHKNPLSGNSIILGILEIRRLKPRDTIYIQCPYRCGCFVAIIVDSVKIWEGYPIVDVGFYYGRYHGHFYEGTMVRVPQEDFPEIASRR